MQIDNQTKQNRTNMLIENDNSNRDLCVLLSDC